jgi:tetratricopeptide (TPR) repeat protein
MRNQHPTSQELASLATPSVAPAVTENLADHLFWCVDCWNSATEALVKLDVGSRRESENRELAALLDRDPALAALVSRFRLERARLEERLLAQATLGELKGLNRKRRREQLAKNRVVKSRALVEEILAESRRSLPLESEEWANLALVAAHQLSLSQFPATLRGDLLAECYVELASSRRRSARWNSAREAIKEGFEHARNGSLNRAIEGSLIAVDGAIDDDLGLLESADEKLRAARACFEAAGEQRLLARTLVQLGYIWMDADPERSLEYIRAVGPLIPQDDKRLQILAESTRIDCLVTLGFNAEALRRFTALAEIWDQFSDPFFQLRRRFMAGRLLEGLGRYTEADSMFREVIALDLEQRSTKALYLDLIYLFGSYIRRRDFVSAIEVCDDAIRQLDLLELDPSSENQMRELWAGLKERAGRKLVGMPLLKKSRRFIRSQWRTLSGDPLATKESAV